VTSSVSGKRSPAELIAPVWRWRRESNPCARLCRPLPHHSATPPLGFMRLHPRADDGIRTRDPHLGKVMRYQLRYIRTPRARSSPVAKHDDSPLQRSGTNPFRDTLSRALFPSEEPVGVPRDGEPVAVGVGTPHTRRLTVATHPAASLILAVRQHRAAAHGRVTGANELGRAGRVQRDALPIAGEIRAVGWTRGR
jgi:hypothetical protein